MNASRFRPFLPVALAAAAFAVFAAAGPRLRAARRARTRTAASAAAVSAADARSAALVQFASVALGGFRGLIADALWLRAGRMQEQRRFVELVQLSDWVSRLEPENEDVWIFHAWNMAYNVSFLLSRPDDRWRWVENGIALLRDRGIPVNPRSAALKQALGWFFQHKIGMDADDAAPFYRTAWAREIAPYLDEAGAAPAPGSFAEDELAEQLRMDAGTMRELADRFGPLDWRVPAASALYWGWLGAETPGADDRAAAACRRMVYQSLMEMARGPGRLDGDPDDPDWTFAARPVPALAPATLAYVRDCLARSGFSGTRYAYVFFLRDMTAFALAEGRAEDARTFRAELVAFFDAFGLGGGVPTLDRFFETAPEAFDSLLLQAGFR